MKTDNYKKLVSVDIKKFTHNGVDFDIISKGERNGLLKIVVTASRNGVALPVNNPLYFKNPPLKHNGEENHEEVLKEIVFQAASIKWQL